MKLNILLKVKNIINMGKTNIKTKQYLLLP
jgi:hypothetical protein